MRIEKNMVTIESKSIDYIHQVSPERLSPQDYKANIEQKYRLLTTDELRKIVNTYKAKSPYDKKFKTSSAEKIELKVAVKLLEDRVKH
jgi:hypothetical protein